MDTKCGKSKKRNWLSFSYRRINCLLVIYGISLVLAFAQTEKEPPFAYRKVNRELIKQENSQLPPRNLVDLTQYLPKDYVKDGSVDYTDYLQKGLNENSIVMLPNFTILINEKGLKIRNNNRIIYFNEHSLLRMRPNELPRYTLLLIENSENLKVINPKLKGDRYKHKGNKGEWGMGISIISSTNIDIIDPEISDFWGDGIYVSRSSIKQSENIRIYGGIIDNNRRNGISIISGKSIVVKNVVLSNTNGKLPMSGLDIEPNTNEDMLENIFIENVTTFNNAEKGIAIVLNNHIGWRDRNVKIKIDRHKDFFSKRAFLMPGLISSYKKGIKPLKGNILISNAEWHDNKIPLHLGANFKWAPEYELSNIKVYSKGNLEEKKIEVIKQEVSKRNILIK